METSLPKADASSIEKTPSLCASPPTEHKEQQPPICQADEHETATTKGPPGTEELPKTIGPPPTAMQADRTSFTTSKESGQRPDEGDQTLSPREPTVATQPTTTTASTAKAMDTEKATVTPPSLSETTPSAHGGTAALQHVGASSLFVSEQQLRSSYTYCYDRGNGIYTRLVALDTLPALNKVPSTQDNCLGMIVLPQPGAPAPPGTQTNDFGRVSRQRHEGSPITPGLADGDLQTTIDTIVESTTPTTTNSQSLPSRSDHLTYDTSQQQPRRHTGSLQQGQNSAGRNPRTATLISHNSSPASATTPATSSRNKRLKIYCDKWVHEGVCAFTQQGCKFKHEMPLDRATQHQLGLFHGLPAWWKKQQAEAAKHDPRHAHPHMSHGQQLQLQHLEPVYMLNPPGMHFSDDSGDDVGTLFGGLQLDHDEYNNDQQLQDGGLLASQPYDGINNTVPGQFPHTERYMQSSSSDNFYTASIAGTQGVTYGTGSNGAISDEAGHMPAPRNTRGQATSYNHMMQDLQGLAHGTQDLAAGEPQLGGDNGISLPQLDVTSGGFYPGHGTPGQDLPLRRVMSGQPWGQHFTPSKPADHRSSGLQALPGFAGDSFRNFSGNGQQPAGAQPSAGLNNNNSNRNHPRTPGSRMGFTSRFGPIAPPPSHNLSLSPSPATATTNITSPFRSGGATGVWARAPFSANTAAFPQSGSGSTFRPQQARHLQQQNRQQRGQQHDHRHHQREPSASAQVVGSFGSTVTNSSSAGSRNTNNNKTSPKGRAPGTAANTKSENQKP
ncbi:hypothetical protein Micbo1qcDRAFT_204879 [Microdochium bolleyi]|uniref:C3H1-type domain-containing protein n=1 Tax=Microdochium bolleyi TaxID=196109 RepID=A0A136J0W2_9PEZI|nr:hypothetical protein Micbo1qcDRAFT_204879 [Microdochium bolleyi]